MHDAIVAVGADAELKEKIRAQGITPRSIGLRDFDAHIRKDMDRLEPLLRTIARIEIGAVRAQAIPKIENGERGTAPDRGERPPSWSGRWDPVQLGGLTCRSPCSSWCRKSSRR